MKKLPALLLNALILPGIGTLMAKRIKAGILQMLTSSAGILIFSYGATQCALTITNHAHLLQIGEASSPLPTDSSLPTWSTITILGLLVFLCAWAWALATSEPEPPEEKNKTQPPPIP